jgi:formate hydrogenlyase subunit 6/NADH:ubiquinone oxidoreductase subunit I
MARIGFMFPEITKHLFKKRATVLYPFERLDIPKGLRGKPIYDPEKCRLECKGLCAIDCPAKAIIMEEVGEKATRPIFLLDRCTFCGQCAESCRFGAITLSDEFELAQYDKKSLMSKQWQR